MHKRRPINESLPRPKMLVYDAAGKEGNRKSEKHIDVEHGRRRRWKKRKHSSLLVDTKSLLRVHPTNSLPVLVLIDMFAVSLVVPLLFQYYKAAGVTSASQRELLSSVFSSSQIAGGLLMGILTDAKFVGRRTILFASFAGSALSYGLIVYGGLATLIFSRVLVGFVKQTMTVSTAILTRCTTPRMRAKHMGRLTAASTVAWIVGPSVGALLYKYVSAQAPALVACALFLINLLLAAILVPGDDAKMDLQAMGYDAVDVEEEELSQTDDSATGTPSEKTSVSIWSNLKTCFTSQLLGSVVVARLIYTWTTKATSYSQLGSFYEDMYGLEVSRRLWLDYI